MAEKKRASRNKTIELTDQERARFQAAIRQLDAPATRENVTDAVFCCDVLEMLERAPSGVFDLVVADPPYNLTKDFNGVTFRSTGLDQYEEWLDTWVPAIRRVLAPHGSLYICGDWRSSAAIHRAIGRHFIVRSRITWEREKGRGAANNWKNTSEDIWFATVSDTYTFNVDAVKLRRRVLAPYTDACGQPRDWNETADGRYRLTHPSNLWTDVTVPFWSMSENTDHPTQKPEKLIAKLILASSNEGDLVYDPFLGSGTTAVVAKKLGRRYTGVEIDPEYCCLALKRLELAGDDMSIQGYEDGVFRERNTPAERKKSTSES